MQTAVPRGNDGQSSKFNVHSLDRGPGRRARAWPASGHRVPLALCARTHLLGARACKVRYGYTVLAMVLDRDRFSLLTSHCLVRGTMAELVAVQVKL